MPLEAPSPASELLAALRAVCDRLGVRWYLFGAQAVIAYGAPRLTADAGVTVELGPHAPSALPLDVVLAGPGPEERFLRRARLVRFGDVEIPVIAPEDLVAAKILAGRPQDLQDAAGVLRGRAQAMDLRLVRSTLALFERALDRSDLVPEIERLLRHAGR